MLQKLQVEWPPSSLPHFRQIGLAVLYLRPHIGQVIGVVFLINLTSKLIYNIFITLKVNNVNINIKIININIKIIKVLG